MKKGLLLICCLSLFLTSSAQQTLGLFHYDEKSYDGYTLFAPLASTTTYLIDNCGREVHHWTSETTVGNSVYLLENGNLLRTARIPSAGFGGGGIGGRIEILDWNSNVVWRYDYADGFVHHHHDVAYMPNGNILVLAWEYRDAPQSIAAGRDPESFDLYVWPEHIVELQPVGADDANIVWEWHLWDHIIQDFDETKENYGVISEHPELINLNFTPNPSGIGSNTADWIHANSIDYNAELDQIVLSSRNFGELWVIDHSTTTEEAASHSGGNSGKGGDIIYRWGNPQAYDRGTDADQKLYGQHNVHWIPNGLEDEGKIMIFNNGLARFEGTSYSSIDVIDPPIDAQGNYSIDAFLAYEPTDLAWTYVSEPPLNQFFSSNVSGAQRLPNGNTLICEGATGTIFEVTSEGETVWYYVNPVGQVPFSQGTVPFQNSVFRALRYGKDFAGLAGKNLVGGEPIELDPYPSDCTLFTSVTAIAEKKVKAFPNPFDDYLVIDNTAEQSGYVLVFNVLGQLLEQQALRNGFYRISTSHWESGLYIVKIGEESFKLLKK